MGKIEGVTDASILMRGSLDPVTTSPEMKDAQIPECHYVPRVQITREDRIRARI